MKQDNGKGDTTSNKLNIQQSRTESGKKGTQERKPMNHKKGRCQLETKEKQTTLGTEIDSTKAFQTLGNPAENQTTKQKKKGRSPYTRA